jgi:hypothetical protein
MDQRAAQKEYHRSEQQIVVAWRTSESTTDGAVCWPGLIEGQPAASR